MISSRRLSMKRLTQYDILSSVINIIFSFKTVIQTVQLVHPFWEPFKESLDILFKYFNLFHDVASFCFTKPGDWSSKALAHRARVFLWAPFHSFSIFSLWSQSIRFFSSLRLHIILLTNYYLSIFLGLMIENFQIPAQDHLNSKYFE